jgi:uncharacterized protein YxeA
MKTILLIILSTLFTAAVFSQDTIRIDSDAYYIVLYTIGEKWDTTKQAHEQLYFKEHSSHLTELRKSKKITLGGRYSDTGMIMLKAKDKTEAETLITKDASIQNKIFKAEIFPFDPFYSGCVE